jgi:cytochrome oxidase Cu insertion factor (SCO1/SenC/PrrC family)
MLRQGEPLLRITARFRAALFCGTLSGLLFLNGSAIVFGQTTNRGFGRLTPEWQSFYHDRNRHPFTLIDNQGQRVATAEMWVTDSPNMKIRIAGKTQYQEGALLQI